MLICRGPSPVRDRPEVDGTQEDHVRVAQDEVRRLGGDQVRRAHLVAGRVDQSAAVAEVGAALHAAAVGLDHREPGGELVLVAVHHHDRSLPGPCPTRMVEQHALPGVPVEVLGGDDDVDGRGHRPRLWSGASRPSTATPPVSGSTAPGPLVTESCAGRREGVAAPRISYVIWYAPRTGSNLLCDALLSTGIAGDPAEHLAAHETYNLFAKFGVRDRDTSARGHLGAGLGRRRRLRIEVPGPRAVPGQRLVVPAGDAGARGSPRGSVRRVAGGVPGLSPHRVDTT